MGVFISLFWFTIIIFIVYGMTKYIIDSEMAKRTENDNSKHSKNSHNSLFNSETARKILQDWEKNT